MQLDQADACHSTLPSLTGVTDGVALVLGAGEALADGDAVLDGVSLQVEVKLGEADADAENDRDWEGVRLGVEVADSESDPVGDREREAEGDELGLVVVDGEVEGVAVAVYPTEVLHTKSCRTPSGTSFSAGGTLPGW